MGGRGQSLDYAGAKERVRAANPLLEVIESYGVEFKHNGRSPKAVCPFHKEKTASFLVNLEMEFYHCFGCGAHGDVFTFVQEKDKVDFKEALNKLAKRAGIELPHYRENDKYLEVMGTLEKATQIYQGALDSKDGEEARSYLEDERFVPRHVSQLFRLGFFPGVAASEWSFLYDKLKGEFSDEVLLNAGVISKRSDGRGYHDAIFGPARIIFPIADADGKIIAFSGRLLHDEDKSEWSPKYRNTAETDLFKKRNTFYGLASAKVPIRQSGECIIVEGYLDKLAQYAGGILNSIGTMGTAFTEDHVKLLQRTFPRLERVVLMQDGDDAGRRAIMKAGELLAGRIATEVKLIEDNDDPASVWERENNRKNNEYYFVTSVGDGDDYEDLEESYLIDVDPRDAMENLSVTQRQSFFDFYVRESLEGVDLNTFENRTLFLRKIASGLFSKLPFGIRGLFVDSVSEKTGIERTTLINFFSNYTISSQDSRYWEKRFLGELLGSTRETINHFSSFISENDFSLPISRLCFKDFSSSFENSVFDLPLLAPVYEEDLVGRLHMLAQVEGIDVREDEIRDYIGGLKKHSTEIVPLRELEHSLLMLKTSRLSLELESIVREGEFNISANDLIKKLDEFKKGLRW